MKNNLFKIVRNTLILGLILSPISAFSESTIDSLQITVNGSSAQIGGGTINPANLAVTNNGSSAQTSGTVDPSTLAVTNNGSSAQTASVLNAANLAVTNNGSSAQIGGGTINPANLAVTNNGSSAQIGGGTVETAPTTPTTPENLGSTGTSNTANTSSGSGSTGGGSSYSSGGGSSSMIYVSDCKYLNSYLKSGSKNDINDVLKLQTYLKNSEGLSVDINGIFDQKTFNAVKAFQLKYSNDILMPWNIKDATGNVFYTTQKKINELVCKKNFALTPAQLAHINAYRNRDIQTDISANVKIDATKSDDTKINSEVGIKNIADTASTANTSFASKVWKFTKWLFGY